MKKLLSSVICILILSALACSAKEIKDKNLDAALLNADYQAFFEHLPFDIMPLTKEERVKEVKTDKFKVLHDEQNNPIGFSWKAEDGTLRMHFRKISFNNNGAMFYIRRKDGDNMPYMSCLMFYRNGKWDYLPPKARQ